MSKTALSRDEITTKLYEALDRDASPAARTARQFYLVPEPTPGTHDDWNINPVSAPADVQAALQRAVAEVKAEWTLARRPLGSSATDGFSPLA